METGKLNIRLGKFLVLPGALLCFFCVMGLAQEQQTDPDRNLAAKAFSQGDYTTALNHYSLLAHRFSADPVYGYYTGACMVELSQDPEKARDILEKAIRNSSSIKPVPYKVWYYLGRACQMDADFKAAIDAYNTFRETARKKETKDLEIEELISECQAKTGALTVPELSPEKEKEPDHVIDSTILVKDTINYNTIPDPVIIEVAEDEIADSLVNVAENTDDNREDKYYMTAREALEYQFMADSVLRMADRYRATLDMLSGNDRETVRSKILSLEQAGFEYQAMADTRYREASVLAAGRYDNRPVPVLKEIKADDGPDHKKQPANKADRPDTIIIRTDTIAEDTITKPVTKPVLGWFSEEYKEEEEIPVNPDLPEGLIYRIQVAAFRNPKESGFFKGLGPVSVYRAEGSDINFYYIGLFRSGEDANKALIKVRQKGFGDAFILALMDGVRVSIEKASDLENIWKDISLFDTDTVINSEKEEQADPPTLLYRVEALRSSKKADDEYEKLIERLADKKAYDIFETDGKEYVYLIGKFLTFESAAAYADLLFRNGIKGAKVVSYLGKKEIPLEKAKELFELYFDK